MAAAISLLLLVIGSGLHLGRSVGDAEQWCQYVASTPEPSLLFYNRIPKSGSTTMKAIIKRQNRNSFDNVPMPVEFWGQSYATKEAKNKVYDFINRNKHSRGKTVIDGHIQYFDFDARKISIRDNDRMEYMQVMRKCTDRSASNYYYAMYDNNRANAAKRANKYEQYKHDLFGTSDIYKCKRNDTCIVKTPIFQNIGTNIISLYMVGSACGQDCKDSPLGKIEAARTQTAAASGRYVTFGPIERLADYLEMLECVYPSYFKGKSDRVADMTTENDIETCCCRSQQAVLRKTNS